MAKRILNRDEFRAWLETKKRKPVGRTRRIHCCPLATFLMSKCSVAEFDVFVDGSHYGFKDKQERKLPKWAVTFVEQIDDDFYDRTVRGAQALRILDSIP